MTHPTEHVIQNAIRNAITDRGMFFRANVGQAWMGDIQRLPDGSILLRNPRPFSTGLPPGFSDLFGLTFTGRFAALEIKSPTGRVRPEQQRFLDAVQRAGGIAGVCRSAKEALRLLDASNQTP